MLKSTHRTNVGMPTQIKLPAILKPMFLGTLLAVAATLGIEETKTAVLNYKLEKFAPHVAMLAHLMPVQCEYRNAIQDLQNYRIRNAFRRVKPVCDIVESMPASTPETRKIKQVVDEQFSYIRNAYDAIQGAANDLGWGTGARAASAVATLVNHSEEIERKMEAIDEWYTDYLYHEIEEEFGGFNSFGSDDEAKIAIFIAVKRKVLETAREVPSFERSEACLRDDLEKVEGNLYSRITGHDHTDNLPAKVKVISWSNENPINLRAKGSTRSKLLGTIAIGDKVTLEKVEGNWGLVTHPTLGRGWIKHPILHTDEIAKAKPNWWLLLLFVPLFSAFIYVIQRRQA